MRRNLFARKSGKVWLLRPSDSPQRRPFGPNLLDVRAKYCRRAWPARANFIEEYRKQHLSIVLILAKATVLNGPPNLDRRYTTAGRKAVSRAHRWICETHSHFTASQEAGK